MYDIKTVKKERFGESLLCVYILYLRNAMYSLVYHHRTNDKIPMPSYKRVLIILFITNYRMPC